MSRKKGKSPSFDAMIKFFIKRYDIPTRKDFDHLMVRMDHLEKLIRGSGCNGQKKQPIGDGVSETSRTPISAAFQIVYDAISQSENPVSVMEIIKLTGFGEKKIRNIVYRLGKMGRILRVQRGLYAIQRKPIEMKDDSQLASDF